MKSNKTVLILIIAILMCAILVIVILYLQNPLKTENTNVNKPMQEKLNEALQMPPTTTPVNPEIRDRLEKAFLQTNKPK